MTEIGQGEIERIPLPLFEEPPMHQQLTEAFRNEGGVLGAIDVGICAMGYITRKIAYMGEKVVKKLL